MRDYITAVIIDTYDRFGPGVLAILSILFFFGITAIIAAVEHRSRRYYEGGNVPFHKNFSTIIDFLILNPLLIVIAARSTIRMQTLPSLLGDKVRLNSPEVLSLTETYTNLLMADFLFPTALIAAAGGWLLHVHRLRPESSLDELGRSLSFTSAYISVATTIMMLVIVAFSYRVVVLVWYLSRITATGIRFDNLEWAIALDNIAAVLRGVNWFYIVLSSVLVVFVIHDLWIYRWKLAKRRFRILGTLTFVVGLAISALISPLFIIHDNLAAAKQERIEELIRIRRAAGGEERVALGAEIEELRQLREWPLTGSESTFPLVGQLLALGFPALLKYAAEELVRRRGRGEEDLPPGLA